MRCERRTEMDSSISLCTFIKNEENSIFNMITSVEDYVDEIVAVDTGSTDSTLDILAGLRNMYNGNRKPRLRVYNIGFNNFGDIRTVTSHLARKTWVLMLDADETLDGAEHLRTYQNMYLTHGTKAWAFPRKRWLDIDKTKQTEIDAYPDYQVRFYINNPQYIWRRELHEYFEGTSVNHSLDYNLPPITINHFHDVFKSQERLAERKALYESLALSAGVTVEGGKEV